MGLTIGLLVLIGMLFLMIGMIFEKEGKRYLTIHQPNSPGGAERMIMMSIDDNVNL